MNPEIIPKLLFGLILLGILFGLYGTYGLVAHEFEVGHICPRILSIPACYIILGCFLLMLVSHLPLLPDHNVLYYLGSGIAVSIATFGSVSQLSGSMECPKTSGGIPMCFISFGIFATLIALKLWQVRGKGWITTGY